MNILMKMKPKILVVGSLGIDFTVYTDQFPHLGETVLGKGFSIATGGKGINQAVQVSRLGLNVDMVGRIGDDSFGHRLLNDIKDTGVNMNGVEIDPNSSTCIATVILENDSEGNVQNRIIVVSGANMKIKENDVSYLEEKIAEYDMVLLQLEIPMEINLIIAKFAYNNNVPIMLNPAPSAPISLELLSYLTYISPNEHEIFDLTGIQIRSDNLEDVKIASEILLNKGVKNVLTTLGSRGATLINKDNIFYNPAIKVNNVIDPTAAGDSFVSAFCTGLCTGLNQEDALLFANYTASLTVSKLGALPSLPLLHEVNSLMSTNGLMI